MNQEIILLENKEKGSDFWTITEKIKQYAETNAALCAFIGAIIVTIVSSFIKFLFYLHDLSYNNYFGVSSTYITITEKNRYSFLLYICGAIVMLLFNALSFYFFKKRKLIKYLLSFFCVAFCAFIIFVAALDKNAFMSNLEYGIKISGRAALFLTVVLHTPTLCSSTGENTSYLLRKYSNTKSNNEITKKSRNKIVRPYTKQENLRFLAIMGGISFVMIVALSLHMGYSEAMSKGTFKTISSEKLNAIKENAKELENVKGWVVVFENDKIFLICPYEEGQEEIIIRKDIQQEINKQNVIVKSQFFTHVSFKCDKY